jgi:hypothetical protein
MRLKHKIYYIAIGVISSMKKIRFILCLTLAVILFQTVSLAGVKEYVILDENVDAVLKYLTLGDGTPKKVTDAYTGKEALYVNGAGRYGGRGGDAAPWSWYCTCFKITENPKTDDEFRYITFAWKKNGGRGIMLGLHGYPEANSRLNHFVARAGGDYNGGKVHYHAGAKVFNWPFWSPSIQVSKSVPTKWEKHTRDLFKDWNAFTLTGIGFQPWPEGWSTGGFWDYVVLHQNPEIQTPVESKAEIQTPVESKGKLTTTWAKLKK